MKRTGRSRAVTLVAAALSTAMAAPPAAAHPHVWVTVESTLLYEGGSIAAIRHKWSFDELYTAMATQGLDANNDGNFDRDELVELAKVNMDGLKEFSYFTYVKLAGQDLALDEPKEPYLEYAEPTARGASEPPPAAAPDKGAGQGGKPGVVGRVQGWFSGKSKSQPAAQPKVLSLHFTLPLKQPVLPEAAGFSFSVTDPSFFIAFELAKDDPVKLGPGAPSGCRVAIGEATPGQADDAKRLGEAFAQQLGGQGLSYGLAKSVSVSCEPRS